jgi:hypothetical protein
MCESNDTADSGPRKIAHLMSRGRPEGGAPTQCNSAPQPHNPMRIPRALRAESQPEILRTTAQFSAGSCCVESNRGVRDLDTVDVRSDHPGEFGESARDTTMSAHISSELIVTATHVLYERVAAHEQAGGLVAFEAAHRS